MKRQSIKWEEIFANHIPGEIILFIVYKQFLQLKNKKLINSAEKWAKDFIDISPKKTYKWLIST